MGDDWSQCRPAPPGGRVLPVDGPLLRSTVQATRGSSSKREVLEISSYLVESPASKN